MHLIDLSKLSAEINRVNTDKSNNVSSKQINDLLTSGSTEKQRLAIGLLLKQTLQSISNEGLLSINVPKALLSAKNILPDAFTQQYIQDRVQQHKLAQSLATLQFKPPPLTVGTVNQWFSGQLIQSIVYQGTKNGTVSLLINQSGQFNPGPLLKFTEKAINTGLINNTQSVQVKTNLNLQPGQQLLLQVTKNQSEVSFNLKHPPGESHIISQFINQHAAKQQALPVLLATLKEIATQSNSANTFFTPKFKNQVDTVLQQFPNLSQLTSVTAVKDSIQNSGIYLESKILKSNINSNTLISSSDLKAALSQLVTLIKKNEAVLLPKLLTLESGLYKTISSEGLLKSQPRGLNFFFDLPANVSHAQVQKTVHDTSLFQLNNHHLLQTRILDQLEGVLSRIVVNQLQTREGGEQSFLNLEIPFRHSDQQEVLQLKIREGFKQKEGQQGNKIWTVNLAFELKTLGGIRIYITLDKQDLAIQFWTENKEAQQLFQKNFSLLNERLIEADFTISQLAAFHGIPEAAKKEQKQSQFIIDERV